MLCQWVLQRIHVPAPSAKKVCCRCQTEPRRPIEWLCIKHPYARPKGTHILAPHVPITFHCCETSMEKKLCSIYCFCHLSDSEQITFQMFIRCEILLEMNPYGCAQYDNILVSELSATTHTKKAFPATTNAKQNQTHKSHVKTHLNKFSLLSLVRLCCAVLLRNLR